MAIAEFNQPGTIDKFVQRLATLFGIAANRIRVVGVYEGSTIVDTVVVPAPVTT